MRACALLLRVLMVLCFGCRVPGPPAPPELVAIDPNSAVFGRSVQARLDGSGLQARVSADFDDRRRSQLVLPTVVFERGGSTHEAKVVKLQSARSLILDTPPQLEPGRWTVRLTDGWGGEAQLKDAFEVTGCSTAQQCDDGLPCTVDVCTNARCANALSPGVCVIEGVCVAANEADTGAPCRFCDPSRSVTAWSPALDATACDDGDLCTDGDACLAGVCQSGTPRTCAALSCHTTACESATGECVAVAVADDTACVDGYECTQGDRCQSGVCMGGASTCPNTAPLACLRVSPVAEVAGSDGGVSFNAACSWDLEHPLDVLKFRFDFEGDGTFDTPFLSEPVAVHHYPAVGLFEAAVEVIDPLGLSGFASRHVSVGTAAEDVVVTTSEDEADPGATPLAPGGTGLSVREALLYANAEPGIRRIRFQRALTISAAPLPALASTGVWWVGEDDVELDFSASETGTSCLILAGDDQRMIAARLHGCPSTTVTVNGDGISLSDVEIWNAGGGVNVAGADGGVGPRVFVHEISRVAVELGGPRAYVDAIRVCRANEGITVQTKNFPATISRSVLWDNSAGVTVNPGGRVKLQASTIDGNGSYGVRVKANDAGIEITSSLITNSGQVGVQGTPTLLGPNGFFGNLLNLSGGDPDGGVLLEDPRYLSPVNGDFRLTPGSKAIDAGADVGLDLNGAAPGSWNGGAPDLGAEESPF